MCIVCVSRYSVSDMNARSVSAYTQNVCVWVLGNEVSLCIVYVLV